MQAPAVLGAEDLLGDQPVLDHVGRAPLAGDHGIVAEMPPEVVGEVLRPAVDLPAAEHLEGLVIHQEHAARALALGVAERADIDALGPAVHGMRPGVAGAVGELGGLDRPNLLRLPRVWLGVEDVQARGADARNNEIAALDVRVRRIGAQARAAGVPAEVMGLVADRKLGLADDLTIARRAGIDVDRGQAVGTPALGIELHDVGEFSAGARAAMRGDG